MFKTLLAMLIFLFFLIVLNKLASLIGGPAAQLSMLAEAILLVISLILTGIIYTIFKIPLRS